jgi:hypothetical protein
MMRKADLGHVMTPSKIGIANNAKIFDIYEKLTPLSYILGWGGSRLAPALGARPPGGGVSEALWISVLPGARGAVARPGKGASR